MAATCNRTIDRPPVRGEPRAGPNRLGKALNFLRLWRKRYRGRHELSRLDDHMLRDIGLTRAEADMEAAKPFWEG